MLTNDFFSSLKQLDKTLTDIVGVLEVDKLEKEIAELEDLVAHPALWDDPNNAQKITSQLSYKKSQIKKVATLNAELKEIHVIAEFAQSENDEELASEAENELKAIIHKINELEVQTLLNGEYDQNPAILTIRSGAGGVDAADFAEMILRMYLRWAEKQNYSIKILDISYAEEAGIKSATLEIDSPYAFGNLSVEAGTHRLVRISPFNSAGKRQTSFAAVEVVPLLPQAEEIIIPENELKIDVFRASGPGGQSVNTTDSAVRITHIPTSIVVSCQNEKSQLQNKAAALRVLQARLALIRQEEENAKKKELAGNITASWGDQMRNYVLAPYQMVKDLRTEYEVNNPQAVFDGELNGFIAAGIKWRSLNRKKI